MAGGPGRAASEAASATTAARSVGGPADRDALRAGSAGLPAELCAMRGLAGRTGWAASAPSRRWAVGPAGRRRRYRWAVRHRGACCSRSHEPAAAPSRRWGPSSGGPARVGRPGPVGTPPRVGRAGPQSSRWRGESVRPSPAWAPPGRTDHGRAPGGLRVSNRTARVATGCPRGCPPPGPFRPPPPAAPGRDPPRASSSRAITMPACGAHQQRRRVKGVVEAGRRCGRRAAVLRSRHS
jgi:hypothetical protein